jgi:endonuclease YncB( thermonuclease family)
VASTVFSRMRDRIGVSGLVIAAIVLAALIFIAVNALRDITPTEVDTAAGSRFTCTVLSVYDGDGPINCAEVDAQGQQVSVRLRGIEAREPDNRCQVAVCPPLSGQEAKAILTRLAVGELQCVSFGPSYNRIDSSCTSPTGVDISCELIRTGAAVRWPEYDPEQRLVNCVPAGRR